MYENLENKMLIDSMWADRETEAEREWSEWVEGIEADDEYNDRCVDFYTWSRVQDGDIF